MSGTTRRVRVVAALITSDGGRCVLVQQRPLGKPRALLWEFPGGKVEPGESDDVALQRELREELGVELEVGPERSQTCHAYPDLEVDLHVYRARISAGLARPLGGQQLREARIDELASLPFCEADLDLVRSLVAEASESPGTIPG